ncbi:MAG: alpha/beta hydrolase, partial [Pseudomonadota bacterium]
DWDPEYLRYTPPTYVDDVIGLLSAEGIERVMVVGTSLGGLMAMIIAAKAPGLLAGAVLNDIGPELAPEGLARLLQHVGRRPNVASWEAAISQAKEAYSDGLPGLSESEWEALTRRSYRAFGPEDIRLDFDPKIGDAAREAGAALVDPWELFGALKTTPTLALRGEISDILSKETFEKMGEVVPDLIRVTVPRRGHVPLLDEPESLFAIEGFLAAQP